MSLTAYQSNDYAGFEGPKIRAYYGHEQTDEETGDWCFVVWKGDKEVFRKTNTQLSDFAGEHSPQGMLIAGLMMYLNK